MHHQTIQKTNSLFCKTLLYRSLSPQIPMFDLSHFLYQDGGGGEEEEKEASKLPDCGAVIQFENCGAISKILNHYTSRELE